VRILIFLPKVYLVSNENICYILKVLEVDKTQFYASITSGPAGSKQFLNTRALRYTCRLIVSFYKGSHPIIWCGCDPWLLNDENGGIVRWFRAKRNQKPFRWKHGSSQTRCGNWVGR